MIRIELNVSENATVWSIRDAMVLRVYEEAYRRGYPVEPVPEIDLLDDTIKNIDEYFGTMYLSEYN